MTVALNGDFGKPRPALVIQSDLLAEADSVLICLLTSTIRAAPYYRFSVPAGAKSGLHDDSQVMVDKIMAVRRARCGAVIGRLEDEALAELGRLLAVMIGLAD